jgi:hypothetical protein
MTCTGRERTREARAHKAEQERHTGDCCTGRGVHAAVVLRYWIGNCAYFDRELVRDIRMRPPDWASTRMHVMSWWRTLGSGSTTDVLSPRTPRTADRGESGAAGRLCPIRSVRLPRAL